MNVAREPKYGGTLVDTATVVIKIKETILAGVKQGASERAIKAKVKKLIDEFCKQISDETYKMRARRVLAESFAKWYSTTQAAFLALPFLLLSRFDGVPQKTAVAAEKQFNRLPANVRARIADLTPHAEYGREWHDSEYRKRLKEAYTRYVARLADDDAKYSKHVSLRNLAEVEVRRQEIADMLGRLRSQGVRLAWSSSHVDCSKRCAPWQGRLYSLDGTSGVENGTSFIPIETAINVVDKYGNINGLFGYNCFDNKTEVFTDKGWKLFAELDGTEKIYTLSPETRETEWQKPLRYYIGEYSGEMVWLHNQSTDLMCTPNHDLLYFTQKDNRLRFKEAKDFSPTDFLLTQNNKVIIGAKKDVVHYNGFIFCVEVPNHTLLVRRNGRVVWCGNCRHRLVPYTQNSQAPREYTHEQMSRERAIDQRQRELEKLVRRWKERGYVLRRENKEASGKAFERARYWEDVYKKYSLSHGRAFYRERITVMREEYENL